MKNEKTKIPKCWICKDIGLVFYLKKENRLEYEMAASCKCKAGLKNSKRIPIVSDPIAKWIAESNFKKWQENNPELAEQLLKENNDIGKVVGVGD